MNALNFVGRALRERPKFLVISICVSKPVPHVTKFNAWLHFSPNIDIRSIRNDHIMHISGARDTFEKHWRDFKSTLTFVDINDVNFMGSFLLLTLIKASAHSFKQFTSRLLKLSFSLSLCTYITRMDVMLDFICMGPVDLTGAGRAWWMLSI